MKILKQGAEAVIFLNDSGNIVKKRISKGYRIKEIDSERRKYPLRQEVRLLQKAGLGGGDVPGVINFSEEDFEIEMEYIKGELLRDIFDDMGDKKRKRISGEIGKAVRKFHDLNIIHGDLTTSNMILSNREGNEAIVFVDFGLGFVSDKIEDKAVDIHLLRQAVESGHFRHYNEIFTEIFKAYAPDKEFLDRFEKVEKRGRYKKRVGH